MQLLLKSYQSTLSVIVYRLTLGDSVVTVLLNGSANWLPQFVGSAARLAPVSSEAMSCLAQDALVGNTNRKPCEQPPRKRSRGRRKRRRREESPEYVNTFGESDPVGGSASGLPASQWASMQQQQAFQFLQQGFQLLQELSQKLLQPGPEPLDVQPLHAQRADLASTAKQAANNGGNLEQGETWTRKRRRTSSRRSKQSANTSVETIPSDAASAPARTQLPNEICDEEPGEVGGNFLAYPFPEIQRNTTFLDDFLTKSVEEVQRLGNDHWYEIVIHRCPIKALQGIVRDRMYVPSRGRENYARPNFMMTRRLIYYGALAGKVEDLRDDTGDDTRKRFRKQLQQAMEAESFNGAASILLLLGYKGNVDHVKRDKLLERENLDEIRGRIVQMTYSGGRLTSNLPLSRHEGDFMSQRYILHAACYAPGNVRNDEEAEAFYKARKEEKRTKDNTAESAPVSDSASAHESLQPPATASKKVLSPPSNSIGGTAESSAVQPALEKIGRDSAVQPAVEDSMHAVVPFLDALIGDIERHYGDKVRDIKEMRSGSPSSKKGKNTKILEERKWLRIVLEEHDGMPEQEFFHATNWLATLSILRDKAIKPGKRQGAAGKLGDTGLVAFASKSLTDNAKYQGPSEIMMGTEKAKICCVLIAVAEDVRPSTNRSYKVAREWWPTSVLIREWGTEGVDELSCSDVYQPMERFDWAGHENRQPHQVKLPKTCRKEFTDRKTCPEGIREAAERHAESGQCSQNLVSNPEPTLLSQTPFADLFFHNLKRATEHRGSSDHEEELMQFILNDCFWGDLFYNDRDAKTPMDFFLKMEKLLQAVHKRRQLLLTDVLTDDSSHYIAVKDNPVVADMFNKWRSDVREWMHESNLKKYEDLKNAGKNNDAHALGKRAFSKYLFQLCGDKFLLKKLIQLPLVQDPNSAAPPMTPQHFATSLASFINDLHGHYNDPQYREGEKKRGRCSEEVRQLTTRICCQLTEECGGKKYYTKELDDLLKRRASSNRKPGVILTPRKDHRRQRAVRRACKDHRRHQSSHVCM